MKEQLIKSLTIELILIILSLIQIFFIKKFNYYIVLAVLFLITLISICLLRIKNKNGLYSKDSLLIAIIFILAYYVVTYFFGFFCGFIYSTYSKSLLGITYNLFTNISLILLIEKLRSLLINNCKYNKFMIISTILVFTLVESTTFISFSTGVSKYVIFEIILGVLLPCFSLNILLTYMTYKTNYKNSILIHLLIDIPTYLLPVFPDIPDYFKSLILTVMPLIIIAIIHFTLYEKAMKIKDTKAYIKHKKIANIVFLVSIILLLILIYLVSGIGRFSMYAIGSPSMTGSINKGDVVIIDKKNKNSYKENDIIAFKMDGKIIIHRINKIYNCKNEKCIITKGDANNDKDDWIVTNDLIIGKAKLKISYLGWPTVSLSEFLEK